MSLNTAIITGGAAGMGFCVAQSMCQQGWRVYILDLNESAGATAVSQQPELTFIKVDVSSWQSLTAAFEKVYAAEGRLDFVFANAGILQMQNFYGRSNSLAPAEISHLSIDINLKAAINTSYLARHYFLREGNPCIDPVLVITASIASFYAQEFNPLYTASKAGILGFMRSVALPYHKDGIRTYAICPGTVRTTLLDKAVYDAFPERYLTPVETIVSTVETLLKGGTVRDSRGRQVDVADNYGLAVEVFGKEIFFREPIEFINAGMREICEAARLENQRSNFKL